MVVPAPPAHDRGIDREPVQAEDPLDPALEPDLLGEPARGEGGGAGGRELGLAGLGLGQAGHDALVGSGQEVQDLHRGEGRVGRQGGGDPVEGAVDLEVDAVRPDAGLGFDVEEGIDLLAG